MLLVNCSFVYSFVYEVIPFWYGVILILIVSIPGHSLHSIFYPVLVAVVVVGVFASLFFSLRITIRDKLDLIYRQH